MTPEKRPSARGVMIYGAHALCYQFGPQNKTGGLWAVNPNGMTPMLLIEENGSSQSDLVCPKVPQPVVGQCKAQPPDLLSSVLSALAQQV